MKTAHSCKTKYLLKSTIIYTLVSVVLLLTAKVIFAQETQTQRTLTITPPSVSIKVDPGQKTEGTLKVINDSQKELTFKADVKDFVVDDEIGTPHILPDNTLSQKYSGASWIGVSPDSFTVPAGKSQTINYYIQVPATARPGGHYAVVVYAPQEALGVTGTGTGVETHLGTLFYIRVNGNIVENASVKSFKAKGFQEYGPVEIDTKILNLSDSHITPFGTVSVKNMLGQTVYSQKLDEHNIFPGAIRDYTNTVGKKLMFGHYTAELHATYGTNSNLTLFATTGFIVFPWKIASVVVLAIIVIILLVIYFMRKKKNKKHTSSEVNAETTTAQTQANPEPQAPQNPQS